MLSLIETKKLGRELSQSEIEFWIKGAVSGEIPNYQTAAILMAIRLNGMTPVETSHLTMAMLESGGKIHFSGYERIFDKHSTGGVGDKVTLVLAPLLAACGLPVAMLSGRGLGFSGGTIDKFEAIKGVNCSLTQEQMKKNLDTLGWTNSMPTQDLVPADRLLYGLRDVTATVDSIPLITASIMSKKLAGGATDLCLDVKCGSSAFMQDLVQAKSLYHSLKENGERCGLRIKGVISRMDEPLGKAVGNYLEMIESVSLLRTLQQNPLMDLIFDLGKIMIRMDRPDCSPEKAQDLMEQHILDGSALQKLFDYLGACGATDQSMTQLDQATYDQFPYSAIMAKRTGVVTKISGRKIAEAARDLGAGRKRSDDQIDPLAGILIEAPIGSKVNIGDPLALVFSSSDVNSKLASIMDAFEIQDVSDVSSLPGPLTIQHID